jgi:excisionase family DNA binding protein
MGAKMTEELLSLGEAAEALSVSEITVKRYIYAGKLKSHKLPGGRHRIPRSELNRLLEGGAAPPNPEEIVPGLEARVEELEAALEHVAAELQVLAAWCARREEELPDVSAPRSAPRQVAILGPGCNKCRKLHGTVLEVVGEGFAESFTVTHITDLDQITAYGPILTPALVVDGRVVSAGRVLLRDEVKRLLAKALE